ncbi:MAG: hypothetical protein BGO69_05275 [Bacteroidetes bacterium 46-16]|nr:MAG: hypothetical protein BGO69_05275 [Bacteroidetes bacterium 46-16]
MVTRGIMGTALTGKAITTIHVAATVRVITTTTGITMYNTGKLMYAYNIFIPAAVAAGMFLLIDVK